MRIVFNYAMSAIYLVLGLYLIIIGWPRLDSLQNKGLGILLIAYGIFRAYRIYSSEKAIKDDEEIKDVKQ
jgi:hypothetical protein